MERIEYKSFSFPNIRCQFVSSRNFAVRVQSIFTMFRHVQLLTTCTIQKASVVGQPAIVDRWETVRDRLVVLALAAVISIVIPMS